jgi:hypothetical protein
MPYNYGDIPDNIRTKKFVPLARHLWNINKQSGYEIILKMVEACPEYIYPELKERLDSTIQTAKAIIEGKIKEPLKTITYTLFPPVISIRGDLGQGAMKLLFGESIDTTFVTLNDIKDGEIFFILNGHSEDGIPVDWWVAGPDDELLERRHIKLGYKIRELPQKTKNVTQAGFKLIDILKDVRNERAPQFATSAYMIGMVYGTGMANVMAERSNWEAIANIWDGVRAPDVYGLPDYWFAFVPWPTLLKTLTFMSRRDFTLRMAGLSSGSQFSIQSIEETGETWLKTNFPEIWEISFVGQMNQGIPMPRHTVDCKLPDTRKKETYRDSLFDWIYPDNNFLKLEEIGVSMDEVVRGVFLDIDHEFQGRPDHSKIISMGTGLKTQIMN